MSRQCTPRCGRALYASLALLAGCAPCVPPPPPPRAPQPLVQPALSAADISKAERHAYWAGYAAGRRYQKQQDAQAAPAPAAPAPPPVAQAPLPPDAYAPQGPAQPVASPAD